MKKLILALFSLLLLASTPIFAQQSISLKFNRTGSNASDVAVSIVDANGNAIEGVTASLASSHSLKETSNAVTSSIVCPNVNANTNPTIELTFTVTGIPNGYTFNKVGLDIHALNGSSGYQDNKDGVTRQWNVNATVNNTVFGSLNNIDIAAGVGSQGNVHKVWDIAGSTVTCNGTVTAKLTITKGTTNNGCFFGLSEITLSTDGTAPAPEPEPEPTPEPEEGEGKVYLISWKNTGANYITEEADNRMTVQAKSVTKAQFWMFIPTEKENCYYIKNTATDRYMGSCNLTPSSSSKITTSATPVEYYVGKSAATSGENANCWFMSSTDCANYSNESAGPRALNKDGASSYVITWTAGVNNVGSYWKLIETADLYELCPFDASTSIGNIGASYNMETPSGKNLTIADGNLALASPDSFDENQEWYFVGAGDGTGYQVASASEPAIVIGINEENIVASEGLTTKWKVNKGKTNGYYYLTSNGKTLKVEGDSLFRFSRLRSAYSRSLKIYNNPCGAAADNYVKRAEISGEGAIGNIIYEANSKPGTWHVVYALDKGEVMKGRKFDIDITLASNAGNSLTAIAHFDWNSDGIFETAETLALNGTTGTAEVTVPEWATETKTRMRLRVNSNGLDLAEDEVYGFIYDFHITVVPATEGRTATVGVNADNRGTATLSQVAESYAYGTTLTAKATPKGDARFVCWREEGVVVSTDAEYTFTLDRNVKLKAYFSPNTQSDSTTAIQAVAQEKELTFVMDNNSITAVGECAVTGIALYTADAAIVARANGNTLDISNVKEGVYVVSATTAKGYKNRKIYLKK